jgi:flagellar basal-body rod protein FlgB
MFKNAITDKTVVPLLHKCMDTYAMRHKAIANNVANAEVPGYQRVQVRFEDSLKKALFDRRHALSVTDDKHIPGRDRNIDNVRPKLEVDTSQSELNGANNVDIESEMAGMAKNTLDFATAATLLRHEFSRFRMGMGVTGAR